MTVLKVGFWWVEGGAYSPLYLKPFGRSPSVWLLREPTALNVENTAMQEYETK